MAEKQIDAKLLEGLTFRTSEPRKIKKDGLDKIQHIPVERPLKPENVLDWKDKEDAVVIVTADGQKYEVSKYPAKRAAARKKEETKEEEKKEWEAKEEDVKRNETQLRADKREA